MADYFGAIIRSVQWRIANLESLLLVLQRSMLRRLAIAIPVVLLAWGAREAIGPPELGVPFLTFFPAAAISALLGGFWSGMLAAGLGTFLATYYYIPPYQEILFQFHPATIFGNLVYLLDELVVCAAMATLHRYYLRARTQYAEMHTLLQAIPEMIWLKNPDGIYLKCNAALERLLGKNQAEIIGRSDRELFGAAVANELRTRDQAAMAAHGPLIDEAWIPNTETGHPILRETIKTAIRTEDGRLIGVLGIGRDITKRREIEETLTRHQQGLEQLVNERTSQVLLLNAELETLATKAVSANQAKSLFLANMSHEIRTPLNAVLGFAHILKKTQLDEEQQNFVDKIRGSGESLLGIINDVLDFSKIEAGRMELHHAPFHLSALLEDLSTVMAGNMHNRGIELIIDVDPQLPNALQGDRLRLLQVLTNLLGNAIKFTDQGHVALRVQRLSQQGNSLHIRFAVEDTGIGIEPKVLEQLFTPFTQADSSTTRRFGGTGLGLAITKRLVELMGGELGAHSTPNVGSQFWLTVPIEILVEPQPVTAPSPPIKILIADDHEIQRDVLSGIARSLGWQAESVASGEAVLERAHEIHTFDAILLDWQMPGLDGVATSTALLADPDCPESPIILMVTAHDQESLRQLPGVAEMDGILAKPITPSALLDAFVNAMAKRARGCDGLVAKGHPVYQGQRLAGIRILVVDDSDINRDVACRILALEGAEITTACQGLEALEKLRTLPGTFDLVLMDVQMPVMDGHAAVQAIRQELGLFSLPVVALTAGALDNERQRALAGGMNDFIAKPFDVEKMMQTILHLVGPARPAHPRPVATDPGMATPSAWPELAGIDLGDVQRRLEGDRMLFLSILRRLLDEFHDMAQQVAADLVAQAPERAAMRLHKLRGIAGNVGAREIHQLASTLEITVRVNPDENIADRLALLDTALQALARSAAPHLLQSATPIPVATALPMDRTTLQTLLTALKQQSCDAVSLFAELNPSLAAHLDAEELGQLTESINGLRFDEALQQLAKQGWGA